VGRIRTRRSFGAWLDEHGIFVGLRGFLVGHLLLTYLTVYLTLNHLATSSNGGTGGYEPTILVGQLTRKLQELK